MENLQIIDEQALAEQRVVRSVVAHMLAAGYSATLNNGGDENEITNSVSVDDVMALAGAVCEERIVFRKPGHKSGSILLVYGNAEDGSEVVADYSTSLDEVPGFAALLDF